MAEPKHTKHEKSRETFQMHRDEGINLDNRIIQITGTIGEDTTFETIDAALSVMEAASQTAPISVRIHSHGGGVYEATAIVGRLRASPCPILTEGYGCIMSAAVLILACGNVRTISPYATVMHHEDSGGFYGTTSQMKEAAVQMEREETLWADWMAQFSTWSSEEWLAVCHKTNYYMTAEEAISSGMVDDFIGE